MVCIVTIMNGQNSKLIWTQTRFAWIATLPDHYTNNETLGTTDVSSAIKALCLHMLEFGGNQVCVPFTEKDSKRLIRRGRQISNNNYKLILGARNQCHANCANLWKEDRKIYKIMTGYALSDDQMWRQHTWLLHRENFVIETTETRVAYYGFALNRLEAFLFSESNS